MTPEQREEPGACPFCGADDVSVYLNAESDRMLDWDSHAECEACGAQGPHCEGEPEAITAWNRRAQVEALTVPQWQPIEAAPRDGTLILLGRAEDEENDRGAISTPGRWHEGDDDGPDNMGHDAGFMDDEFQQFAWGRSFGNSAYKNGGFQPTHWMLLPAAPTIPAIPGTKEGA